MKKIIITIVIIAVAFFGISYILNKNKAENEGKTAIVAEKNAAVSVKVATVKTEDVNLGFTANGNFVPIQELTFSAEKSGKVISVLAKEGDYVRVGQTLLTVRGDVINVNAQQAQAVYQNAKSDYERYENAFKTGGVTKQQLDQAKLALTNAQSNLTQANINVGDTKVKAPINGYINKKYIEPGSILAGMPATALFDIVNVSKLKLTVTVNESQVASLKLGNSVSITASVYPDKTFSGKITFIAAKADASLNFPVEIEITNNANNDLKAGMYGTANFGSNNQKQNLKVVPRNAFVGSVSSNEIFVVENNVAKLKKVVAGRILGDKVEIINGLNDGDVVIITGQINLQDGNTVEIIK
ncbi:efflux RND transporter periplasmic adaptor subunit [Flavobacterium johnsoniae]|uniref:Efflux transporter, RND family, MFP subunit n=1 Tax=Flavobacterium johnsoniae (strain ATCC 17061 / DSM 2064 / JCM 8514 / BCRC 14874 / CCUG 350202 / NBRC 14942 / NCIMB 11054 / UW101) TaxID=376686 RepID=A5FKH6_FLAJ1|nr:efflux RND transporter periplasmic adaptor subunit [Flavobacterium johnsoniae]ABQ04299.1 efflux transporter, RND family, MFP subunit [Flavobacterium johnsoniae UW101]OXG02474.1 efflux transporter periplasmic adaptor subunit [Flavobacterium johnsoniae UW101]WQG83908.1 efflux RND transporter periplasmic adaptor subunit [Flavobacterium johnsoniae UW101]SHK18245.1 RND family efflux transporter, MFP subunit [Flavobacterium johnsoniae]